MIPSPPPPPSHLRKKWKKAIRATALAFAICVSVLPPHVYKGTKDINSVCYIEIDTLE
jgi:hypothetical protein